jgi:hypothetical protein
MLVSKQIRNEVMRFNPEAMEDKDIHILRKLKIFFTTDY